MLKLASKDIKEIRQGGDWQLKFNGVVYQTVKAHELYLALARNAFIHNDPGVFFMDTVERDNNGWWAFKMDRCNPCGEIPMPAYSLCCLGSLNLVAFVIDPFTPQAHFDFKKMAEVVRIAIRALDDVLDATQYPLEKIEEFSKQWRRVGLGFTGLGDALAMLGLVYGSEDSLQFCEFFGESLRNESYKASVELAKEKGMAPGLKKNPFSRKPDPRLLQSSFISKLPADIRRDIGTYGLRNIGLNTAAPTGTISLTVGNNCSSGIEPIFALEYDRNVRTGKGDETRKETIRDYAWLKWKELHPEETEKPHYFVTAAEIDPYAAVDVQATLQKYVDHSISKTLNLPKGYTFEQYQDLFKYAYKKGLKGITTFNPDGSMKGVLEAKSEEKKPDSFILRSDAPKRPNELPCDIHYVHANNQDFVVLAGLLNGSVYEIFVDEKNGHELGSATSGRIVKKSKGEYNLIDNEGKILVEGLSKNFNGAWGSLARMISMSLRHGVPLQFIIEQLQRSKEFLGFEKAVSRVLKHYITAGEHLELDMKCPQCGHEKMNVISGCPTCPVCGYGKCN